MPFRVTERDLDLLQLEELHADAGYANWFAAQIGLDGATFLRAEHSVSASANGKSGETDVLAFFSHSGTTCAVMIEDKVAASFTERQAARYHERGETLLNAGACEKFLTVLIAPQSYLASVPANDPWHKRLSVETLSEWFALQPGFRAAWRRRILSAITQRARGVDSPDKAVLRAFYSDFSIYLREKTNGALWHNLGNGDPAGPTIRFTGSSESCMIWWKIKTDQMTLQLDKHFLNRAQALTLPHDVALQRPEDHKRATEYLVIDVPPLDLSLSVQDQLDVIDQGIKAAMTLRSAAQQLIDGLA